MHTSPSVSPPRDSTWDSRSWRRFSTAHRVNTRTPAVARSAAADAGAGALALAAASNMRRASDASVARAPPVSEAEPRGADDAESRAATSVAAAAERSAIVRRESGPVAPRPCSSSSSEACKHVPGKYGSSSSAMLDGSLEKASSGYVTADDSTNSPVAVRKTADGGEPPAAGGGEAGASAPPFRFFLSPAGTAAAVLPPTVSLSRASAPYAARSLTASCTRVASTPEAVPAVSLSVAATASAYARAARERAPSPALPVAGGATLAHRTLSSAGPSRCAARGRRPSSQPASTAQGRDRVYAPGSRPASTARQNSTRGAASPPALPARTGTRASAFIARSTAAIDTVKPSSSSSADAVRQTVRCTWRRCTC